MSPQAAQNIFQMYIQTNRESRDTKLLVHQFYNIYIGAKNNRSSALKFLPDFIKLCTPNMSSKDEVVHKIVAKGADQESEPFVNVLIQ